MAGAIAEKSNAEWQAEQDARTLADAQEIKSDSKRATRALKAAKKIVTDAEKTLKANMTIAGKKVKVKMRK